MVLRVRCASFDKLGGKAFLFLRGPGGPFDRLRTGLAVKLSCFAKGALALTAAAAPGKQDVLFLMEAQVPDGNDRG